MPPSVDLPFEWMPRAKQGIIYAHPRPESWYQDTWNSVPPRGRSIDRQTDYRYLPPYYVRAPHICVAPARVPRETSSTPQHRTQLCLEIVQSSLAQLTVSSVQFS